MNQCPQCGATFPESQSFCSNCGTKLVAKSEPDSNPKSVVKRLKVSLIITGVIAAVAVIVAGWFYSLYLDTTRDLSDMRLELSETKNKLEKLNDLVGVYGYGSKNYYAYKSVVVLREFEAKNVTIYANSSAINSVSYHNPNSGISCEWSGEWSIFHTTQLIITGNSTGLYTIEFTNDTNSDSFEILVIVLD